MTKSLYCVMVWSVMRSTPAEASSLAADKTDKKLDLTKHVETDREPASTEVERTDELPGPCVPRCG